MWAPHFGTGTVHIAPSGGYLQIVCEMTHPAKESLSHCPFQNLFYSRSNAQFLAVSSGLLVGYVVRKASNMFLMSI